MKQQKIFWGSNIKFLRERKNLSQESLAQKLGITRSKLNALENGQTKSSPPEDYIQFSEFFKISIDSLIKIDLSLLSELKLRTLEAGSDVYITGSNIRVLAITVDKENRENMEYIPVKAKAGYRSGYNDPEYIASLPKFSLPNLPKGTYRMFPTTGDSMLPIPEGSEIITQYVEDWKQLKADTPCIVILRNNQDFVFKQVTVHQDGNIELKSLNKLYDTYTVPADEVLEIWKYYKYQTATLPQAETDMQELKRMIEALQGQLLLSQKFTL